ncbi:hypothetical protein CP880_03380 [Cutibacterium namnetense]|uniref:Uncharacterized protein n=1 Tax=Cutibacterium namnetense TaxID=1574624 RepID=A0ABX9IC09_9ACTN|nr:hypothetical protein CP880_03380 [Cutibacterium namnetense]
MPSRGTIDESPTETYPANPQIFFQLIRTGQNAISLKQIVTVHDSYQLTTHIGKGEVTRA